MEEKYSDWFQTEWGMRQGSVLWAFFFNIIMYDVTIEIQDHRKAEVIAYVNDVTV